MMKRSRGGHLNQQQSRCNPGLLACQIRPHGAERQAQDQMDLDEPAGEQKTVDATRQAAEPHAYERDAGVSEAREHLFRCCGELTLQLLVADAQLLCVRRQLRMRLLPGGGRLAVVSCDRWAASDRT